jgi:hypothetical protein
MPDEIITEEKVVKKKGGRPAKRRQGSPYLRPKSIVDKDGKVEEVKPRDELNEAWFVSKKRELVLWLSPKIEILTATGRMVDPHSGQCIEFKNGRYKTSSRDIIKKLCNHRLFGANGEFFPDPSDPSGYWTHVGYFRRTTQEVIERAPMSEQIRQEAMQQIPSISANPTVVNLRTT